MDGAGSTIILVIAMVLLLVLALGLQFWRVSRSPMGKVVRICNNVKFNEKLSRELGYNGRVKKFKTGAWNKHKDAVGFLPEDLLNDLSELFHDTSEINDRIDAAVKFKSDSYLETIGADQLAEPSLECRDNLQAWIRENMGNPDYLPKKRSIFRLQW